MNFCCCSVTKSCLTFCDFTDCCSMPGSSVLYCLPEFAQTNVHWVSDAIQPTHPPFSSCLQSFPASESFPMSWLFTLGGQSIGALALSSILPMNIQGWFSLGLTDLIFSQSKELSRVFSSTTILHQFFSTQLSLWSSFHFCTWLLEKPWLWLYIHTFVSKVMSLLFNMLSGLSSFDLVASVTVCSDFIAQEKKICHCFHFFPFYLPWSDGTGFHDLNFYFYFLTSSFKTAFSLFFTPIKRFFSSSSLSAIRVASFACLRLLIFLSADLISAYDSSSLAFLMMYSAYNKLSDNIQPCHSPFPYWIVRVLRYSVMSDSANPWIVAHQAPLPMGFSRQEYWSGVPFPPPGNLPNPGIKPTSLTSPELAGRFFTITGLGWVLNPMTDVCKRPCEDTKILKYKEEIDIDRECFLKFLLSSALSTL